MKKRLLTLVCAVAAFGIQHVSAQCTPGSAILNAPEGSALPTVQENLPCAYADNPSGYVTQIDMKTMSDTNISYMGMQIAVYFKAFKVLSVNGVPNGFTYTPDQEIWQNTGSYPNFKPVTGCVSVNADASTIQGIISSNPQGKDFPITVVVDVLIDTVIPASPLPLPIPLPNGKWLSEVNQDPIKPFNYEGYVLKVRSTTGSCGTTPNSIREFSGSVTSVYPNPASNSVNIKYNSITGGNASFNVYDITGHLIESKEISSKTGENQISLNISNYANGLYHFTINAASEVSHGTFIRSVE